MKKDYYSSSENNNNPVNSEEDTPSDKKTSDIKSKWIDDDTDKEVCIDNQQQQIESASAS